VCFSELRDVEMAGPDGTITRSAGGPDTVAGTIFLQALLSCWPESALWLLDGACRVVASNANARRLLTRGDVARADGAAVRLLRKDPARALSEFVAACAARESSPGDAVALRLDDRNGPRRYIVRAMALQRCKDARACVLLSIEDVHAPLAPSERECRELLGLTAAESRVACGLARGLSVPMLARELGISPLTARTHVKHVFKKSACHSQAQLAARLARVALQPKAPGAGG
jgi:DNA-binding NarL/FixJ family response regulator